MKSPEPSTVVMLQARLRALMPDESTVEDLDAHARRIAEVIEHARKLRGRIRRRLLEQMEV